MIDLAMVKDNLLSLYIPGMLSEVCWPAGGVVVLDSSGDQTRPSARCNTTIVLSYLALCFWNFKFSFFQSMCKAEGKQATWHSD